MHSQFIRLLNYCRILISFAVLVLTAASCRISGRAINSDGTGTVSTINIDATGDGVDENSSAGTTPAAATNLGWQQSSPSASYSITATWTTSVSSSLSNQKIQFYADGTCTTTTGSLIDLASASTQTYAFNAPTNSISYSFKIRSYNASGDESISNCSTALAVSVAVGAKRKLAFISQPTDTVATNLISPQITVQIQDANGNLVSSATDTITLSILKNPGKGTLAGTLSTVAVGGVATFNSISIEKSGVDYVLQAVSPGLYTAYSAAFDISPMSATKLFFISPSPSRAPTDQCAGPYVVQMQDDEGNPVPAAGVESVNLSETGVGIGEFYDEHDCSDEPKTTFNYTAGSSTIQAYFKHDMSETFMLFAINGLLSSGSKAVTVAPEADIWKGALGGGPILGRSNHSMVWTGSEIIIWGGHYNVNPINSGGIYNPTTNSWTAEISRSGGLSSRYAHCAVWTGTEMLVWGGYNSASGTYFADGGRYNPATDTWGPAITTTDAPSSRHFHRAVWTGTEMIFWGGLRFGAHLNTGHRYNPTTDTWGPAFSTTGAPTGRTGHTAVWTGSEMIIWGGREEGNVYVNTGGRYNPTTDTWGNPLSTTDAPSGRISHAAVWTGSEMILWGGYDGITVFNDGGRYNPLTDTWGTAPTATGAPIPRHAHNAIWSGTEMIIFGGYDNIDTLATITRYNPTSDAWSVTASNAPTARFYHTAVWTGSEMIVWGGADSIFAYQNGGRYNPTTDSWNTPPTTTGAPSARYLHSAVWTGTEMLIWGGYNTANLDTGGRYNPTTDTWGTAISTTNAASARSAHSAIWTGTEMIVWGGNDGAIVNTGKRYNPTTNTWGASINTTGAPAARAYHTAIWNNSEMVIWGGMNGGSSGGGMYHAASDTWSAAPNLTGTSTLRNAHSAIWTGSEMIVWGGHDGGFLADGVRYDPTADTWNTPPSTSNAPQSVYGHTAVWTGMEMLIYGGYTPVGPVNGLYSYIP